MNNDENTASDQSYLTAPQQSGGRGYLMYNCTVTSTTPGVDTANEYRARPGYFGRPWMANTSEVVFFNTTVETTDHPDAPGASLIVPQGWNNSLGGESPFMYEYNTKELSGENNLADRAGWTKILTEPVLSDGTAVTVNAFLGDWGNELKARGLVLEPGDPEPTTSDNPATGLPGVGAAIALIAIAGSAVLVAKKRK